MVSDTSPIRKAMGVIVGCLITLLVLPIGSPAQPALAHEMLTVDSVASPRIAKAGNRGEGSVYLAVTSAGGPVSGLSAGNFQLTALQVGPGGCVINVVRVQTSAPGVYRADIVPGVEGCTWRPGDYVIMTRVNAANGEGVALARMTVS